MQLANGADRRRHSTRDRVRPAGATGRGGANERAGEELALPDPPGAAPPAVFGRLQGLAL